MQENAFSFQNDRHCVDYMLCFCKGDLKLCKEQTCVRNAASQTRFFKVMIVGAGLLALPDWAKREVGFTFQGEQCFLEKTQDHRKMHG